MFTDSLLIHKMFSAIAARFPDRVALQIKRDSDWQLFSYRDLEASSRRIAAFLIDCGLKKGERVSIILENRPEWPMIYLGAMFAGLTCVPIDPQLTLAEIKNLLLDAGAKAVFSSQNIFREKISTLTDLALKFVILDRPEGSGGNFINFSDLQNIRLEGFSWPEASEEDIASLIYTSGTTGLPKGVMLSHKNICSNFESIRRSRFCNSGDNFLSILPLHHTYAFTVTMITPLLLGAKITYAYSFKPQDLGQVIKEAGVTLLVAVPQLFNMLHKAIFEKIKNIPAALRFFILPALRAKVRDNLGESLRALASGGARLEPKIAKDLSSLGLKAIEGYGLTETAPVATMNPPEKVKFGSVGPALPGVQIKIENPDSSGIGEVLIKGANVMQGYFKQPQLTAQAIKGGWFYSGDLGRLDKEGYLFLTGREKDVIVLSSGKNIYPEELEEYYSRSPYIKEICILSTARKSFGQSADSLYALIVPDLEYLRQKNEVDIPGKIRWEIENLAKGLPSYQHIMGFKIIKEELPRTALKKIKRYAVKEKYLEPVPLQAQKPEIIFREEDAKNLNYDTSRRLIDYLSGQLNLPVSLDNHLEIDLGIDSLSRVELGLGLEALFKIKIPDEFLYAASTVRELIISVQNLIANPEMQAKAAQSAQISWSALLKELPPQAMRDKIKIKAGLADQLLLLFFKIFFFFTLRIFWDLRVKGRVGLPKDGPYLICPNHASFLDGFFIFGSLPTKIALNVFFVGYSIIFDHPLVSWIAKAARLVSIDPNIYLVEAMQTVSYILRQKKIVCIFPEGRRAPDESVGEFKKGVGILIKELDIPVVPVYIKGSYYSWPRTSFLPRFHPVKVIFAPPVSLRELAARGRPAGDEYEAAAKGLREEVLELAC